VRLAAAAAEVKVPMGILAGLDDPVNRIAGVLDVGDGLRTEESRGSDGEDAQDSGHRQNAKKGSHGCLLSISTARTACRIASR
jgi:hypothetical protein